MNILQALVEMTQRLQWWHWWIIAAVLAAAETLLPGAVAIWFAAAAAVVGALLLVAPVPWPLQVVLFGILGALAAWLWRRYDRSGQESPALPYLNQRSSQYIGQVCVLSEPIAQGYGKARVGDGVWKVRGPDLPAGSHVKVIAADGAVLVVEAILNDQ
jgi:membrane protein implicated in regulation of membrane protease activity